MITGFEEYTKELNKIEREEVLPLLVKVLELRKEKKNAISSREIIKNLKTFRGIKINPPRIRKMIHIIRTEGLINCLVASHYGYYVTKDPEEIKNT